MKIFKLATLLIVIPIICADSRPGLIENKLEQLVNAEIEAILDNHENPVEPPSDPISESNPLKPNNPGLEDPTDWSIRKIGDLEIPSNPQRETLGPTPIGRRRGESIYTIPSASNIKGQQNLGQFNGKIWPWQGTFGRVVARWDKLCEKYGTYMFGRGSHRKNF